MTVVKHPTYTIHTLFKGEESFLQMSRSLLDLKQANRTKISRWVSEMGVVIDIKSTVLLIREDGEPAWMAVLNAPRLSWRPYTPPSDAGQIETAH